MGIESFASPGLRWSLLLEDHPGATYTFRLDDGSAVNVPAEFGGGGKFCVCTINIPGHEPVEAFKPAIGKTPDEWVVLCTKTLGRALKKAGYPDNLTDLKALVLWRQRTAERHRILAGAPPLELTTGTPQPAVGPVTMEPLEIPRDPNFVGDDGDPEVVEVDAPVEGDDAPDAPAATADQDSVVADGEAVPDIESLILDVAGLKGKDRTAFELFCQEQNIPLDATEWTDAQAIEIDHWFG